MCLNSNLTNFIQVHGPHRIQKVYQSPNSCPSCGSNGTLKTKTLDGIYFHQTTLVGILISFSKFLDHIGQNKGEKLPF